MGLELGLGTTKMDGPGQDQTGHVADEAMPSHPLFTQQIQCHEDGTELDLTNWPGGHVPVFSSRRVLQWGEVFLGMAL